MPIPVLTLRVDWENKGTFTGAFDAVTALLGPNDSGINLSRGASANLAGEADGELSFELDNIDDRYTLDRNWVDNPSFEAGTGGWETYAISGLTAAATSIAQVTDNAPAAGTKAAEIVLPATLNAGVFYRIPYPVKAGVAYSWGGYAKSVSGTLNIELFIASEGTPADIATAAGPITVGWTARAGSTWTPTADRDDVVIGIRSTSASAATVRLDRLFLNPGATANAYLEAPTRGMLLGRRPVHFYATFGGTDTAKFFGYVSRVSPDPADQRVRFTCRDPLARMAETDIVVAADSYTGHTPRTMRMAVLADFERGTRNLLTNPSFETDTTGWSHTGTSLTRTTTDAAPGGGSAYGAFVASASGQRAYITPYLTPIWFNGQVYRASVWLKVASGTATWKVGFNPSLGVGGKNVIVTSTWQRFTVTFAMTADASYVNAPLLFVEATAAGTVRIDNAAVTRGQALHPYSATGSGRWPNWVANGDFEGGLLDGWYNGFSNLIGNPSFETDTTGWSVAGDAFTNAATSITRVASDAKYGSARADLTMANVNDGAFYAITATFVAGVTYDFGIWIKATTGTPAVEVGLGSNGTPADFSSFAGSAGTGGYALFNGSWTPSADRTDAHFFVRSDAGITIVPKLDGAFVYRRPGPSALTTYSDTGPGGGGAHTTSAALSSGAPTYGSQGQVMSTPAIANAGRVYDFNHFVAIFPAGQPFTVSVWLNPTSNMPYKIGIGSNKGDGTWDETSTTGTATANTPTQVTVTWTPSADRDAGTAFETVLFIYQTDATARDVSIDGVRVIPGSSADAFEMAHWDIDTANGTEWLLASASIAGTALSALETLNALDLSRHWIRPAMSGEFYTYVSEDRTAFMAKSSVATFTETIDGWEDLDVDEGDVVNVIEVSWSGGREYYSDEVSVREFGPHPGASIAGASFFPGRAIPDLVGPALVDRYKDPRPRPTLVVRNEYAKMLAADLNDVITVTLDRFGVRSGQFVVLREDLAIRNGGRDWTARYKLEEYRY